MSLQFLCLLLLSYEYQRRSALFRRDGGCRQPPVPVMPMKKIWIDGERAIRCSRRMQGRHGKGKGRAGARRRGQKSDWNRVEQRPKQQKVQMNQGMRRGTEEGWEGALKRLQTWSRATFVHIIGYCRIRSKPAG